MTTTDPTAMVRLRNGAQAPMSAVTTTMLALRRLEGGDLSDLIALYEVRELARDPQHVMWGTSPDLLKAYGLLTPDGRLHDITRDVVLSAVAGDVDVHLVGPLGEEPRP